MKKAKYAHVGRTYRFTFNDVEMQGICRRYDSLKNLVCVDVISRNTGKPMFSLWLDPAALESVK